MANDLNQCTFTGRLAADPESKSFTNGNGVTNLRLAVGEQWKNKDGERQEKVEWVSVSIFSEGLRKVAESYLRKGSKVLIVGKMQTRQWEKDGEKRYSTEIVLQGFDAKMIMLDSKPAEGGSAPREQQRSSAPSGGGSRPAANAAWDDEEDSVPF